MILQTIWFALWGLLWAVYFMLDGYVLGSGAMMPWLAKNDTERRVILNATGPHWEGNQVWLITAGGVTFAAFPTTYAVMFSSLYSALMLLLFALIIRGVVFEFRGKMEGAGWRRLWDVCYVVGSFLPALLLGVAFANIFAGLPIDKQGIYHGTLLSLLNPYGLLGGVLFVLLFKLHGSLWITLKAQGDLEIRAALASRVLWPMVLVAAAVFLVASWFYTKLYQNYLDSPFLFVIPLLAVVALLATRVYIGQNKWWQAWFTSAVTIVLCAAFGVVGLFPNMIPSSLDPKASLTAFNSSSSPLTLKIMLGVALVMVPIVILYQLWVYRTFRQKVSVADMKY